MSYDPNYHKIQCVECKAYGGAHAPECIWSTREELMRAYRWAWENYRTQLELRKTERDRAQSGFASALAKAKEQKDLWQGKFAMVKAENNALRKKLYFKKS